MSAAVEYALDRVGAKVIIIGRYVPGNEVEATITKVGRKWSHASNGGWHTWLFDKTTGAGKPERGGFSAGFSAWTPESRAAYERRSALEERLRKATNNHYWIRDLSSEQIEAVLAVVEREREATR